MPCRSENYYPDTLLIYPYKLDCGIPAADGLDNSFRIYENRRKSINTPPFIIEERLPSATEFNTLILAVGWQEYFNLEATAKALQNSLYGVVAKTGNNVVGMCRIVGDGAINYYLQDLVVLPAYQRRGIGTQLMDRMMEYFYRHAPDNAYVGLFAVKGTQAFYRRYGFQGPDEFLYGMARKIKKPSAISD